MPFDAPIADAASGALLTARSVTRGALLAGLLTVVLSACGGAPASPSASAVDLPTTAPPVTLSIDDLAGRLADLDGQTVQTTGYLLIRGELDALCGGLLESYPPQCGGPTFRLLGQMSADVLDGLDRTNDTDPIQAWWGLVTVTGRVAAVGADGAPTITIDTIELAPAP
ncbi:MAG: hypothetical protein ACLGIJ_02490 [Candidatus Limnocylindria bacterium]